MKEISIEWCPTRDMVADFMTMPLQGSYFKRLIDITICKKHSVRPNGVQVVTGKVTCEELVSKFCINEFGAIIKVVVNCTTGVCWGLYSMD